MNRTLSRDSILTLRKLLTRKNIFIFIILTGLILVAVFYLRAHSQYDVGGYKLPQSPSVAWSTEKSPQPDFSNDDSWNESYLWSHVSSHRICRGDLAELNPYELNGSRYSAVGSTMSTTPQLAMSCIIPVPQKSLVLLLLNLALASIGCMLCIRLLFSRVPQWLGIAFAATGPMLIYGTWPHSSSFAWAPLCVYSLAVLQLRGFSWRRVLFTLLMQVFLLLSGQPEITLFGFVLMYGVSLMISCAQRSSIRTTVVNLARHIAISVSAALLSAFALIPVGSNALSSAAAESRGVVSWVPWSAQWIALKANGTAFILQFLDPALHSSANTYRTAISPQPYSRLTAWTGFISLCLVVATLVFSRRRAMDNDDNKQHLSLLDDKTVLSLVRYLSISAFVSCLISLRTPWTEALCSRIPGVASLDRNLFRYLTVFFIFFAALACCHLLTKRILLFTFGTFLAIRLAVFVYLWRKASSLNEGSREFRNNVAISYSTLVVQRWAVVLLSVIVLTIFGLSLRAKKMSTIRVLLSIALCIEISQILFIRPQNWVVARPSPVAQDVRKIVNASGQRLLAPASYFATIGTWLEVPSPTGYSLISEDQNKFISDLQSCKGANDFIYFACGYDENDSRFYDASNVGWVISPTNLDNVDPRYHASLIPVRTLENGFSLFQRIGNPSPIFSVEKSLCSSKRSPALKDIRIASVKSSMASARDPDHMTFTVNDDQLPSCALLSLSYDEGYSVTSENGTMRSRSLGGFLLVDTSQMSGKNISVSFETPGRSQGKLISLASASTGLLALIAVWVFQRTRKRHTTDIGLS